MCMLGRVSVLCDKLLLGRCLVNKVLLLLTANAVVILLLAPSVAAQSHTQDKGSTPRPTSVLTEGGSHLRQPCSRPLRKAGDPSLATSFAPVALISVRQPCMYYLRRTGGPPLVTTLILGSLTVMISSGVVIRRLLRQ
jgi:hypothetical protein